jgi:hypothetical protein
VNCKGQNRGCRFHLITCVTARVRGIRVKYENLLRPEEFFYDFLTTSLNRVGPVVYLEILNFFKHHIDPNTHLFKKAPMLKK